MTLVAIPADEIYCISKIIPLGSPVICKLPVHLPCSVQCLRVAISGGNPGTGKNEKAGGARGSGFGIESGFLAHNGHHHRDGNIPSFIRQIRAFAPFRVFPEDFTNIVRVSGPGAGTAIRKDDQYAQQKNIADLHWV